MRTACAWPRHNRAPLKLTHLPPLQSVENAARCGGGDKVLEGVAAPRPGQLVKRAVEQLTDLGNPIERPGQEEHPPERVACSEERNDERNHQHRIELHDQIETQVSLSRQFCPVPPQDTEDPHQNSWCKQSSARASADKLGEDDHEERREQKAENQPVPNQGRVAGRCVVVGRSKASKKFAEEECEVGSSFPALAKGRRLGGPAHQPHTAGQADNRERKIRDDVPEMWNAGEVPLIGEVVILGRLRDRW